MRLGELSTKKLASIMSKEGVSLRSGPFVLNISSPVYELCKTLHLMYENHPIETSESFVDFYASVNYPNLARKYIKPQIRFYFDGKAPFYPLPEYQAFAALEWGLNWVISNHCHQYLILHAAVVEKNGKALILPGEPGSGKSTLCAFLVHNGWRLLSDELTIIDMSSLTVIPLCRPISLKNQSIDVIRSLVGRAVFGPLTHETSKGVVTHIKPPIDSIEKMDVTAKITWVIFPKYCAGADTCLSPRPKAESFLEIGKNAFNYSFHGVNGMKTLTSIISNTDIYDFEYSDLINAAQVLDNLKEPEVTEPSILKCSVRE